MVKAIIFDCTGVLVERGQVNHRLMQYIRSLRPKYKIGMLSNLSRESIERRFTKEERDLFDVIALASETGATKPDPRAYQIAAERLECEADKCIFVDDFVERCEAAREQGMVTILYDNADMLSQELDSILQAQ